jgi:hypothetical protein
MNEGLAELPHYLFHERLIAAGVAREFKGDLETYAPPLFRNPLDIAAKAIKKLLTSARPS